MASGGDRWRASIVTLGALVALVGVPGLGGTPASGADEEVNAIVEGTATAAAGYLPAMVNPNLDFWPAFSGQSIDSESAHGIAAGFWPGAIGDAFIQFYSFAKEARTTFGVAESLWPGEPHDDDASTSDFGSLCDAGRRDFLMPSPAPTASFPDLMLDTCQLFWGQFGPQSPLRYGEGRTQSRLLRSSGSADLGRTIEIPLVLDLSLVVGAGHSESRTAVERAGSRTIVVSEALSVLKDIRIGAGIHIDTIRFWARSTSDGTLGGAKTERSVRIGGATMNGRPVEIDALGVGVIETVNGNEQYRSLNDALAEQGLQVRLIPGTEAVREDGAKTEASSGILAVEVIRPPFQEVLRSFEPQPPQAVLDALEPYLDPSCRAFNELYPTPLVDPPPEVEAGQNPLYRPEPDAFPWNQLPPELEVVGAVPPPPPVCAPAELNRNVTLGFALGRADTTARIVPLPPPPPLPPAVPDILPRTITETTVIPGSGGGGNGTGVAPPAGPPPPVFASELNADVARRVQWLYAGLVLLVAALVGGRSAFRNLVRT